MSIDEPCRILSGTGGYDPCTDEQQCPTMNENSELPSIKSKAHECHRDSDSLRALSQFLTIPGTQNSHRPRLSCYALSHGARVVLSSRRPNLALWLCHLRQPRFPFGSALPLWRLSYLRRTVIFVDKCFDLPVLRARRCLAQQHFFDLLSSPTLVVQTVSPISV